MLLHPDSSAFSAVAPDTFYVKMETSKGDIVIQVVKEWAPNGATRFYNLVRNGFYDGDKFFRVVEGFAAQFGVTGYPKVDAIWGKRDLPADPIVVKNMRGMVSYAQPSPDKRTTQLFINLSDNPNLDRQKFAPIGRIVSGWGAARSLNDEYGDLPPEGQGPSWNCVYKAGNKYMSRYYPKLDSITRARLMEPAGVPAADSGSAR